MKPKGWDQFIKEVANEQNLKGRLREIFLVRFAYENWRKPDTEVWELAEAASHETYKKQMTELYGCFSSEQPNGCPELDPRSKGPGKFQILREWLKDIKYPDWKQASTMPTFGTFPVIETQTQIKVDSPIYIPRPPIESDCCQGILKPGALIRIKAPEKMGKTSLLNTILAHAEANDCRKVYLNLRAAEGAMFATLDKFLRWFCANISRELGLKPELNDYWDEELFGSLVSCKTYFQSYLLENIDRPLALGLDNLDRVFEYADIAKDFLPMLRYWHEEANNLEIWQNLRLVIANSTEVYIKLDANQSPFNVGRQVKLPGFNLEQVLILANYYGFEWSEDPKKQQFAKDLIEMLGGHPYLVRLALDALAYKNISQEKLLEEAPTQGGIYGSHLRRHWNNLQSSPELAEGMKQVVKTETGVQLEPSIAYKLESMGLINLLGDEAHPSCELYHRYFQDNL
ncbi:AAA-like domain-containing protein [Crocosphaera sp. UHCC 0190]|uniref:AAA-like domain-containing protein n=1 Tax=Crocosphaera sp. UHCC 0190 TaxID=3110246 RepID=UPI002B21E556|nr:AAA-like domain-containing protein [Crocosphaera sp. UHCC 0190]MEA5511504.1 AAA-like domain-containing protein [Crocosphaera sp. UHCC 0190]